MTRLDIGALARALFSRAFSARHCGGTGAIGKRRNDPGDSAETRAQRGVVKSHLLTAARVKSSVCRVKNVVFLSDSSSGLSSLLGSREEVGG